MVKLKRWLWAIAFTMLSALLLLYVYDMEKDTPIPPSSTQSGGRKC